jgi:hypothetical protein
VPLPR